jgi:hypothetical protein
MVSNTLVEVIITILLDDVSCVKTFTHLPVLGVSIVQTNVKKLQDSLGILKDSTRLHLKYISK